jgi:hypothetical protein
MTGSVQVVAKAERTRLFPIQPSQYILRQFADLLYPEHDPSVIVSGLFENFGSSLRGYADYQLTTTTLPPPSMDLPRKAFGDLCKSEHRIGVIVVFDVSVRSGRVSLQETHRDKCSVTID